jgi:AraC-like DNA-binding protein
MRVKGMKSKNDDQIATYPIRKGVFSIGEIISGKYERFDGPRFIVPHRRDFFSFFFVKTGYIGHSIDFRHYTCKVGDIFFMSPQQVYLVESAADIGGISIACKPEFLMPDELSLPIVQNLYHQNKITLDKEQFSYLSGFMENMLSESSGSKLLADKLVRSYFSSFLIYLSRAYQQQFHTGKATREEAAVVEKFRALINENWKTIEHVTDYAKRLYISAGHLNHLVKRSTGKRATELIQEKKLTEAKRLLLHSKNSVKEVAFQTGFEDPAYFNRFFKKWNGITPQEFREEIRKKYNTSL